jgi:MerR family transcriptional regulator, light-induced transcriptional regulator
MRAKSSPGMDPRSGLSGPDSTAAGLSAAAPTAAVAATLDAAKQRVARLARTIESEVIPRLVEHHRESPATASSRPSALEVTELVQALMSDAETRVAALVQMLQARGVSVESLFLDLLAPAARQLGDMWEQDRCDFATVTVALGRMQRLLRLLSPAFGGDIHHPPHGRRVLLTQPEQELHMFGLAMVAEFFRREGWDVLGGVAGVGIDAVKWVGRDWFDVLGFSIGHESRLPWLRDVISDVREASRNRSLIILVGGPVFTMNPGWAEEVGADATTDGKTAPALAETMVLRRVQEQLGQARLS